MTNSS